MRKKGKRPGVCAYRSCISFGPRRGCTYGCLLGLRAERGQRCYMYEPRLGIKQYPGWYWELKAKWEGQG